MKYHPVIFSAKIKMRLLLAAVSIVLTATAFSLIAFPFAWPAIFPAAAFFLCPALFFAYVNFQRRARFPAGSTAAKFGIAHGFPYDSHTFSEEMQEKLFALEDIGEFFGASLKPADMFRIVGHRVGEIIPFDGCFLFLTRESGDILRVAHSVCEDPQCFGGLIFNAREGLAGRSLQENNILSDRHFAFEDKLFPQHFKCSIAAPISVAGGRIGVLALSSKDEDGFDENSLALLDAVVQRTSQLFHRALNNHRNAASAFTHLVTDLPNEAAFYLILEQQIAESVRYPERRPLTILCTDIKDFSYINEEHGHAVGDQLLNFTGHILKNQLRQMDFLSHPSADEFWAILPGASAEIVELVIERLDRAFSHSLFTLPSGKKIDIELHFGIASFKKDGEIASALVQIALKRKSRDKSLSRTDMTSVIPFPLKMASQAEHSS